MKKPKTREHAAERVSHTAASRDAKERALWAAARDFATAGPGTPSPRIAQLESLLSAAAISFTNAYHAHSRALKHEREL